MSDLYFRRAVEPAPDRRQPARDYLAVPGRVSPAMVADPAGACPPRWRSGWQPVHRIGQAGRRSLVTLQRRGGR